MCSIEYLKVRGGRCLEREDKVTWYIVECRKYIDIRETDIEKKIWIINTEIGENKQALYDDKI